MKSIIELLYITSHSIVTYFKTPPYHQFSHKVFSSLKSLKTNIDICHQSLRWVQGIAKTKLSTWQDKHCPKANSRSTTAICRNLCFVLLSAPQSFKMQRNQRIYTDPRSVTTYLPNLPNVGASYKQSPWHHDNVMCWRLENGVIPPSHWSCMDFVWMQPRHTHEFNRHSVVTFCRKVRTHT